MIFNAVETSLLVSKDFWQEHGNSKPPATQHIQAIILVLLTNQIDDHLEEAQV